jgi:hypothetical protein
MLVNLKTLEKRQVPRDSFAVLEDRIRIQAGRPQLYGTQIRQDFKPYEIEDPLNVDERRAKNGLPPVRTQECVYEAIAREMKAKR